MQRTQEVHKACEGHTYLRVVLRVWLWQHPPHAYIRLHPAKTTARKTLPIPHLHRAWPLPPLLTPGT
ncbi:hypothetical protein GN956_G16153 [Arapaima gigas]